MRFVPGTGHSLLLNEGLCVATWRGSSRQGKVPRVRPAQPPPRMAALRAWRGHKWTHRSLLRFLWSVAQPPPGDTGSLVAWLSSLWSWGSLDSWGPPGLPVAAAHRILLPASRRGLSPGRDPALIGLGAQWQGLLAPGVSGRVAQGRGYGGKWGLGRRGGAGVPSVQVAGGQRTTRRGVWGKGRAGGQADRVDGKGGGGVGRAGGARAPRAPLGFASLAGSPERRESVGARGEPGWARSGSRRRVRPVAQSGVLKARVEGIRRGRRGRGKGNGRRGSGDTRRIERLLLLHHHRSSE